ncbi:MAG: hypothetical protein JNL96_04685 [Planctomycetaceae bacterium]|nr:hypothetical protein [Planctomycetaceae bacterium]
MGARQKLNRAYVNGALLCAVGAGLVTQSGFVFVIVLAICLGLNVKDRLIRPDHNRRF